MRRSMVAGAALLGGIAIAAPMAAWSAAGDATDTPTLLAQAAPDGQSGMGGQGRGPGMGPGMGRMGMGHGWDNDGDYGGGERGQMGHRPGGWMQGWMHRMMQMSPQQRCEERFAKRAGVIAYTIAKLNLTADQRPLWDKVQAPLQQGAEKERQLCASLKPREQRAQETILDKMNQREQFLSARLQTIQSVKPALEQFYQSLTPEQKATIDHPFKRG